MSFNLVVLEGELSADPELRTLDSGGPLLRCLVTVRSMHPVRIDVIPVEVWDPSEEVLASVCRRGQEIWMVGILQRRFEAGPDGRKSQLEVIARAIGVRDASPVGDHRR